MNFRKAGFKLLTEALLFAHHDPIYATVAPIFQFFLSKTAYRSSRIIMITPETDLYHGGDYMRSSDLSNIIQICIRNGYHRKNLRTRAMAGD